MLWQDRNGNWFSTVSPIDIKINNAILDAKANGTFVEWDDSKGSLFDQMFGDTPQRLRDLSVRKCSAVN